MLHDYAHKPKASLAMIRRWRNGLPNLGLSVCIFILSIIILSKLNMVCRIVQEIEPDNYHHDILERKYSDLVPIQIEDTAPWKIGLVVKNKKDQQYYISTGTHLNQWMRFDD